MTGKLRSGAWLLVGTAIIGVGGYVFLALSGHQRFAPADWAALSALFMLVNMVGPGLFFALEQETTRLVAQALTQPDHRIDLRGLVRRAGTLTGLALLLTAGLSPFLVRRVLAGHADLVVALAVCIVGSAAVYFVRGLCAGTGSYRRYAATLIVDGGIRIAGPVVLLAAGDHSASHFGWVICLAPGLAAVACARGLRLPAGSGPRAVGAGRALAGLTATWLLAYGLGNAGPVVLGWWNGSAADVVLLTATTTLTRVPSLLLGPAQAVLLPRLVRAAASADPAALRRQLSLVLAAVTAVGAAILAVGVPLGGWAVQLLFGTPERPGQGLLWLLGGASAALIAALMVQPALVATGAHRIALIGWIVGLLGYVAGLLLPVDALTAVACAQLFAPLLAFGVFVGWLFRGRTRPLRDTTLDFRP